LVVQEAILQLPQLLVAQIQAVVVAVAETQLTQHLALAVQAMSLSF
jgi:hypothetical protein